MQLQTYFLFVAGGLSSLAEAATNDEWSTRSIYQIVTDRFARPSSFSGPDCQIDSYCGGSWAGIVEQLDYIQGLGFTAIQISPVNKNLEGNTTYGEAFHGYWVQDLYQLNANFGTDADLKNLSAEIHKRDMYLLVDVVAEDMAYNIGNGSMTSDTKLDYSVFNPFDSEDFFNTECSITDWSDADIYQNCWLSTADVVTPSLKTQNNTVVSMLSDWITQLVANYSIDGLRLDGAKQAHYSMFQPFIKAAGVYAMAEVDQGEADFVCNYQNMTGGLENYPVFYTIQQAFSNNSIPALVTMKQNMQSACAEPQYLATFSENQDQSRFASLTSDLALAANTIAYTILADGIPKIYYGQEQHLSGAAAPDNRSPLWPTSYDITSPLYIITATTNKLRNWAIALDSRYATNSSTVLSTTASTISTRKGPNGVQIVSVFSNQGADGGSYNLTVNGAADEGTNLTEVLGCTTLIASSNGTIIAQMDKGQPKVFFPTAQMNGSGLCGYSGNGTSTTATASSTGGAVPSASSTKKSEAALVRRGEWMFWMGTLGLVVFL